MTRAIADVMAAIIVILLLVPAALGIIDAWTWVVFDRTASGLAWAEGRALTATAMLGISVLVAIIVNELRD